MEGSATTALLLTLLAGLATGIGSIISMFTKRNSKKFLSTALGFSAGVMLYVSFSEMLTKSHGYLCQTYGEVPGLYAASASFFGGMLLIMLIDNLIPSPESDLTNAQSGRHDAVLQRMGLFTALAIAIHNFPEGLATFTATLEDTTMGISIAVAIAIHNIPEGIATAVPVYYATGSRKKSFYLSFLSGLTEPLGAVLGYLILRPFLNDTIYGIIFAMIAGIMVYIACEELIPMAREYDKGNTMIGGLIAGMCIMAVSLILFI